MINVYHKRINSLYDDGKLDENDINSLDNLKADFADAYTKGKVSKQHYTNLKEEISVLYEEIYKKRIDLLQDDLFCERSLGKSLDSINDVIDAYAKRKINEKHYNLLNGKISDLIVVFTDIGDIIAYRHGLHFCREVNPNRNQNKV